LFLTLPVSWRGTIAQYAGRLHRLHDSKREVRVYDYADLNVPMLSRMFERRCHGYEAFFYRRLGTLPETSRRFQLNAELPIPFDGWGNMEVDLLCADARLVIELDGAQLLAHPEAYRRDRRKDALLQQNSYFVLRFMAEDLGKLLDCVLDTVLGALVNR
jgi:superfamily II DNA or RNA helicase